ncbi:MAG: GGDEF domain-containing protein [Ruminiclostridium sp.]|nr:GGDEF domain-containing protein [Ruminiclostridium sp.]
MTHNEKFDTIAEALLTDYSSVYYVDAVTNEYCQYLTDPENHTLRPGNTGSDFFGDMKKFADRMVYEDDRGAYKEKLNKDAMYSGADNGGKQRFEYRVMLGGKPVWHTVRVIRGISDDKEDYFVFGVINIDSEVRERTEKVRLLKERELYNCIAESLASNYDVIYYVDMETNGYEGFTTNNIYGKFNVDEEGENFFTVAPKNASHIIHPLDYDKFVTTLDKDNIIARLELKKKLTLDYRMVIDGNTKFTRLTVMWASDKKHIVIGVENIDFEVQREREHLKALNSEKELARRDDLTGTRNKTAYLELSHSVQKLIDSGINCLSFALVVCDINGLKQINDSDGHHAGDEYIRSCAKLICDIYSHSPVFRVGGDEFAVFIRGEDYDRRERLLEQLRGEVLRNRSTHGKPVIASGMSSFDPEADKSVAEVFKRADAVMYENKRELKS